MKWENKQNYYHKLEFIVLKYQNYYKALVTSFLNGLFFTFLKT